MARKEYRRDLDALRDAVLEMGEVVSARLRKALTALERDDPELARSVVTSDHRVNELYLDIERDCIDLLALQQPVAGDLRFVAASFKIITDLERIADLATNLGAYPLSMEHDPFPEVDLTDIGALAVAMLEDAMAAYADGDAAACRAIAERDDELDARCERAGELLVRDLVARDVAEADMEPLLAAVNRLLLTVRDLERVGDHAVNVAARTLYMVENDDELIF